MKPRPIDDCLEAQLNYGFASTSYLKLNDIDYIAGLALKVAQAVAEGKQRHESSLWCGKCLDLSQAYEQVGVLYLTTAIFLSFSTRMLKAAPSSLWPIH